MNEIGDFAVGELEAQLQMQFNQITGTTGLRASSHSLARETAIPSPGFLEGASHHVASVQAPPRQANIKIVAADLPYPTVSSMSQDMSYRRDVAETLVVAKAN